jgi:hypothetical protein
MKKLIKSVFLYLAILLLNLIFFKGLAQSVPQGITYQGLARNSSGVIISNQSINVKTGIYAPSVTGALEWEETHALTTNQLGLFYFVIGQGVSTGAGGSTTFSSINWGANNHFIKIAIDQTGGTSFVDIDTIQFWSVPYAMYSGKSDSLSQPMRLSQLSDVDTAGVFSGAIIKWNGIKWIPAPDNDSDTALYAYNAGHSNTSDTSAYAINVLSTIDSIPFSYNSDSALFSTNSGNAVNSINSNYCDTATYAFNTGSAFSYWNLNGNTGTDPLINFIGTSNNKDLVFKTNNTERMRITSAGKIGIGTTTPSASLHIVGDNGLIAEGTFGSGALPPGGAGTRMVWYPKKAAFRSGTVTSTQWDDVNIGNYSFASGYNTKASGDYSTVFGSTSVASGKYSFAACENATASGISSVAMGTAAIASGPYAVAIGRASQATDSFAVAIGYHNVSTAKAALSFGYQTTASGNYSLAFGYRTSSNGKNGCFVFADNSALTYTLNTADNQFMVRASGGVIFYSNSAMTMGVSLPAGGGSWASVSDKNKKEHFKKVDPVAILNGLNEIDITSWNYKTQSSDIRHIGPMAQDFYKTFHLGESDTTITTIDIDGVSLAAIQALKMKTEELYKRSEEMVALEDKVSQLEKEKAKLEKRISMLEKAVNVIPVSALSVSK